MISVLFVLATLGSFALGWSPSGGSTPRCERIWIPMCKGIGYNFTSMPNDFHHQSQEEAGIEVNQFWPLVATGCSPDLKFFLCSMFVPICIEDYPKPLPVCRSFCERARAGCAPIMERLGFPWPVRMDCERFPVQESDNLCMEKNNHTTTTKPPTKSKPRKHSIKDTPHTTKVFQASGCACKCRPPFVTITRDSSNFNQSISVGNVDNCGIPCRGVFSQKNFTSVWITLSGLCCVFSLMTIITFLIDTDRFKYPERPIVFLSVCYFMVSVGYLLRVVLGHEEVACEGRMIRYNATGLIPCTIVFLLVYFFSMAASIWWVVLSFTWFLAAGLKWGNEAIASYSGYYHLIAWLIPAVKSILVLVMNGVDGDPVAGICSVGPNNLQVFVLAPLLLYFTLATSFLLGGFISLFRIRSVIKHQCGIIKTDKLEKLIKRIGIFSVLHTALASVVIGCHIYESSLYSAWISQLVCPCKREISPMFGKRLKPMHSIIMLKYLMSLVMGITSGMWIWSGKTLESWRRVSRRLFGGRLVMGWFLITRSSDASVKQQHPVCCSPCSSQPSSDRQDTAVLFNSED